MLRPMLLLAFSHLPATAWALGPDCTAGDSPDAGAPTDCSPTGGADVCQYIGGVYDCGLGRFFGSGNGGMHVIRNGSDEIVAWGLTSSGHGFCCVEPLSDMVIAGSNVVVATGGPGADTISLTFLPTLGPAFELQGSSTLQIHGKAQGKDGDDHIDGSDATPAGDYLSEQLFGDLHRDTIFGRGGDDLIWGNDGDDHLYGDAGNDTIRGGNHDDYIEGNDGHDQINAGDGSDEAHGDLGNDVVCTDIGNNDYGYGEDGDDSVDDANPGGGAAWDGGAGWDQCTNVGGAWTNCEVMAAANCPTR